MAEAVSFRYQNQMVGKYGELLSKISAANYVPKPSQNNQRQKTGWQTKGGHVILVKIPTQPIQR